MNAEKNTFLKILKMQKTELLGFFCVSIKSDTFFQLSFLACIY